MTGDQVDSSASVMKAMLDLARAHGIDTGHALADIAAASGLPHRTVSRALSRLRTAELVRRDSKRWYVIDLLCQQRQLDGLGPEAEVLARVRRRTAQAVLLYTLHDGRERRLVGEETGPYRELLHRAPLLQQKLRLAPVLADPAGHAIAAFRAPNAHLHPLLRETFQRGWAHGPAPVDGWSMTAVPVWDDRDTVIGSIAVLATATGDPHALRPRRAAELLLDAADDLTRIHGAKIRRKAAA